MSKDKKVSIEDVTNIPDWATHWFFDEGCGQLCIETDLNYSYFIDGKFLLIGENIEGLDVKSQPITRKEKPSNTKVIEFKKGELQRHSSIKIIKYGHLAPEGSFIDSESCFEFTKDVTITINVEIK